LFTQTAHLARNLVATVERGAGVDPLVADPVSDRLKAERDAVAALIRSLTDKRLPTSAPRLDGQPLASLDQILATAGERPTDPQRRLLRQIDRLDETIGELQTNVDSRRKQRTR
jgi:hypothetical protein